MAGDVHVPNALRAGRGDCLWDSGRTLPGRPSWTDCRHVSIFHVWRHAPASGARSHERAVTIKASLGFPDQVRDRYPAVIVVHGLSGYRDAHEGYIAAELRKAGFATLTYDTFAARGTTGASLSGSPGYLPIGVADAYAALRLLSNEPRIDADRIAITGFSYGGEIAHLAAFEMLRSALSDGVICPIVGEAASALCDIGIHDRRQTAL